jgi:phage baseplate assembly protein W
MKPFIAIHYPIAIDEGLGRLAAERSYDAHVEQLILQVIFTAPGERINRPDFGCGLRRMLFAPNSDASANLAQVSVRQALDRWLGSVIAVDDVKVTAREETLEAKVTYVLLARQERRSLELRIAP